MGEDTQQLDDGNEDQRQTEIAGPQQKADDDRREDAGHATQAIENGAGQTDQTLRRRGRDKRPVDRGQTIAEEGEGEDPDDQLLGVHILGTDNAG